MSRALDVRAAVRERPLDVASRAARRPRRTLRSKPAWVLALLVGSPSACFPVEQVDVREDGTELTWPSVQQIDDFDDGDWYPDWDLLEPWKAEAWARGNEPETDSGAAPGASSGEGGFARFLQFELSELNAGAYVSTSAPPPFLLDLTGFDQLVFQAKAVASEGDALPQETPPRIWARFDCPGAADQGYSPDGEPANIGLRYQPSTTWQQFALDLRAFAQPAWQAWVGAKLDKQRCLAQVDMLAFEVDLLLEPERLAGALTIDDVRLRTAPVESSQFSLHEPLSEWDCFPYSEFVDSEEQPSCSMVSKLEGALAPSMSFEMLNDTQAHYRGVALCAKPERGALNLSGFGQLTFEAKLEAESQFAPQRIAGFVELWCAEVLGQDPPFVRAEFHAGPEFQSFELQLSEFQHSNGVPLGDFDQTCLARVDEVCAVVELGVGERASGTLTLDHLVLR